MLKPLETIAKERARNAVDSGKWLRSIVDEKFKSASSKASSHCSGGGDKKEERRKKATSGGKSGGGSQGRETKTRSTKKKYNQTKVQRDNYESEEEERSGELVLVSLEDVESILGKDEDLADIDQLVRELAENFQPKLNGLAFSLAREFAETRKKANNDISEIEERLNMLVSSIRIFDKGIRLLDKSCQQSLAKYLIKTVAVDFVNEIFKLAAQQNVVQLPSALTTETRRKILDEFPNDVKEPLSNVLSANTIEEFLYSVEPAMTACCLVLRKFDKKKERPLVLAHRQALLEQLGQTLDPAVALHLVTSILFTAATHSALHMSGRHVASILAFLQSHLEPSAVLALSQYHGTSDSILFIFAYRIFCIFGTFFPDRVLEFLSSSNDRATKQETQTILDNELDNIKDIANNFNHHLKSRKINQ